MAFRPDDTESRSSATDLYVKTEKWFYCAILKFSAVCPYGTMSIVHLGYGVFVYDVV